MAVSQERVKDLLGKYGGTDDLFQAFVDKKISTDEYKATLAALVAAVNDKDITVRANPDPGKRTISLYGLGRMPITLYRSQWDRMLSQGVDAVRAFITSHGEYLPADKKAKAKDVPDSLIGKDKPFRVPAEVAAK